MQKLNAQKYMCIINSNAVGGRLSENYFLSHEIFWTRNILSSDLQYYRSIYGQERVSSTGVCLRSADNVIKWMGRSVLH